MRARRSQSRVSRVGALAALAGDCGRRGMGRLPRRERFQLLECAAEGIRRGGESDAKVPLAFGPETGSGCEEDPCLVEYTRDELHGGFPLGNAPPEIERAPRRLDRAAQPPQRVQREIPPLAVDAPQGGTVRAERLEPRGRGQ